MRGSSGILTFPRFTRVEPLIFNPRFPLISINLSVIFANQSLPSRQRIRNFSVNPSPSLSLSPSLPSNLLSRGTRTFFRFDTNPIFPSVKGSYLLQKKRKECVQSFIIPRREIEITPKYIFVQIPLPKLTILILNQNSLVPRNPSCT